MRCRFLARACAAARGYFWLPCPLCGQMFGGHEVRAAGASIQDRPNSTIGHIVCPDCAPSVPPWVFMIDGKQVEIQPWSR